MMDGKDFILLRLLNRKVVAFIAIFFALGYLLPDEQGFYLRDMWWVVVWFIGGIFTWKKKTWAAVLLAVLASYELIVHLIPDINSLESDVERWKEVFVNLSETIIYRLTLAVYSFGVIVESYVICYGLKKVYKPQT